MRREVNFKTTDSGATSRCKKIKKTSIINYAMMNITTIKASGMTIKIRV